MHANFQRLLACKKSPYAFRTRSRVVRLARATFQLCQRRPLGQVLSSIREAMLQPMTDAATMKQRLFSQLLDAS